MNDTIDFELSEAPDVKDAPPPDEDPKVVDDSPATFQVKSALGKKTILFVDDDTRFLDLCTRQFAGGEYELLTANCAESALDILAAKPVDVLVSDMSMPGQNGAELAHEAREKYPDIIRIIVSGRFDFTDTLEAINTGHVDHYVTKPFNDRDLKLTIYRALLKRERDNAEQDRQDKRRQNARQRARELGKTVAKTKRQVEAAYDETLQLLQGLVASSSPEFEKCAQVSFRVAEAAGQNRHMCEQIRLAALFQDLSLLNQPRQRPSELEGKEREVYIRHPIDSAELLANLSPYRDCAEIIRGHHERFDGKGFPEQRKGEEIPVGSRILSLANAYLNFRCKNRLSHGDAVGALSLVKERYDPELLEVLSKLPADPITEAA